MDENRSLKNTAIGAGIGAGVGLGAVLLMRPGLRRTITHGIKSLGSGGSRAAAAAEKIPAEVLREADEVGRALQKAGIDPAKARIGIVATPGTGKSTMARALEQRLGVKNLSLDKAPSGGLRGDRSTRYLARDHGGQMPAGSILEQTYLPHSANLDQFDAVIHLQRDTPDVISSILKRGKGAHQADYVNYGVLKDQIAEGFNALKGRTISRGGRATIKVRPKGGTFESATGRLERAKQLGLDVDQFSRLTQAQQLDSLARKKITTSYGVTSSYRRGRIATDASLLLGGGAVGALAYPHMNKEAALDLTDKQKNVAIGAGVGLGAAALLTLARRPGLRAHLRAKGKSLFSSGEQKQLAKLNISGDIPKESVEHARKIIRDLKRQGYSPEQIKKMRIGVVGSSGSGKSSLARAIEQELGHTRISLDEFVSYNPLKAGNVDVERGLKVKGGMKPGTIAEQTQLLHSGDPSHFDLLVKIERPAKDIREGLLERGHAAVTADYTDFTKAQRSVNEAFHTAGGTHHNIGNGVEIRVNPLGGKDAAARRVARAQELGLNINEFKALSQRDQIQSLARGKMTRKQSFRSHISSGALGQDIGIGSALLFGGGATGAFMSREKTSSYEIPSHLQAEPMSRADKEARAHAALFGLETEKVAGWGTTALAVGVPAVAGAGIGALASDPGDRFSGAVVGGLTGAGVGLAGKAAVGKFNEASSAIAGQSAKTAPGAGITDTVAKTASYKRARIHAALEKVAFGAATNALIGAGAGGLIGAAAGGPDNRFGGLLAGAALGAGGAYGGTKLLAGGADDVAKAVTKASPAPGAADDVTKVMKDATPPTPTTPSPTTTTPSPTTTTPSPTTTTPSPAPSPEQARFEALSPTQQQQALQGVNRLHAGERVSPAEGALISHIEPGIMSQAARSRSAPSPAPRPVNSPQARAQRLDALPAEQRREFAQAVDKFNEAGRVTAREAELINSVDPEIISRSVPTQSPRPSLQNTPPPAVRNAKADVRERFEALPATQQRQTVDGVRRLDSGGKVSPAEGALISEVNPGRIANRAGADRGARVKGRVQNHSKLTESLDNMDDMNRAPVMIRNARNRGKISKNQANDLIDRYGLNMEKFSSLRRRIMNVI